MTVSEIPVMPSHRVAVLQDICLALERQDVDQTGTIHVEDMKDLLRTVCNPEEHDEVSFLCSKYCDIRPDNCLNFMRLWQTVNSSFSAAPSRTHTSDASEISDAWDAIGPPLKKVYKHWDESQLTNAQFLVHLDRVLDEAGFEMKELNMRLGLEPFNKMRNLAFKDLLLMIRKNVSRRGSAPPGQELSMPESDTDSLARDSVPSHKKIPQPLAAAGFAAGHPSIGDGRTVEMINQYSSYDSPFVKDNKIMTKHGRHARDHEGNLIEPDVGSHVSARSHHEHKFGNRTIAGHGDILCHQRGRRRDLTPEQDGRTGRQIRRNDDGTLYSTMNSKHFTLEDVDDYKNPTAPPRKYSAVLPNLASEHWSKPIPGPPASTTVTPFATDIACNALAGDKRNALGGAGQNMQRALTPFATENDDLDAYREAINRRSFNDRAGTMHVAR